MELKNYFAANVMFVKLMASAYFEFYTCEVLAT